MQILLYKTTSAREALTKSFVGDPMTLSGTCRDSSDVLQPYFEVTVDVTQYNYAYVPEFGRYYFVTAYRVVRAGLYGISLAVDVLMTYADAIKELRGKLTNGANANPYNNDADFGTDVRTLTKKIDFAYTFERQDSMVLVGLVGK